MTEARKDAEDRTPGTPARTGILLDLVVKGGKPGVLEALAAEAAQRLDAPVEALLSALRARERLGPTALGRGVALPHARLAADHPPLLLLARLARPVDWEARDGEGVDLILLVLWPEAEAERFLPTLAELCRVLREARVLRDLRAAATPEEAAALIPLAVAP